MSGSRTFTPATAEERERLLKAVADLRRQPVVTASLPPMLRDEPDAIPGQAEVCEQHWGQA